MSDTTKTKLLEEVRRLRCRVEELEKQQLNVGDVTRSNIDNAAEGPSRDETAKYLQDILDSMFAFVGLFLPDGTLIETNRAPLEAAGLKREDVIGKPFWDTYWWSYSVEIQEQLQSALQRAAKGETVRYDVPIRISEEERITIDVTFGPLYDSEGHVIQLVGSAIDITQRKQAEEELRLSAEIMNKMAEGVSLIRVADSTIFLTNPTFDEIFGYDPGELVGKHVSILNAVAEKNPEETAAEIIRCLNVQGSWNGEIHNVRKDGTTFWTSANVSTFVHPRHGMVWITVQHDITDRKRAQEENRELREKLTHFARLSTMGEMATGLAHELNQPLAAMATYCYAGQHFLADTASSDLKHIGKIFEKLAEQTMRAGEIIRRLRELVCKTDPIHLPVDVGQLIQEVFLLMEPEMRQNEIRVEQQAGRSGHIAIADKIQIQQVLVNLILNALDAMSKTDLDHNLLKIKISRADDRMIEVAIRDTGKGILVEAADQVFDAFFSTKEDGMGMGLAISRTIIESHRGRLWVTPNSDRGVTFHFTLPSAKEESNGDGQ